MTDDRIQIRVYHTATLTMVVVADQNGNMICAQEFTSLSHEQSPERREFRALAWTMGVLLRRLVPAPQAAMRRATKTKVGQPKEMK